MLGGGALVLAGCALGFALGRWTATAPSTARVAEAFSPQPVDLAPALAELQQTSAAILAELRERREADVRVPAGGEPGDAEERLEHLAAAFDDIAKRLEKGNPLDRRGRGYAGFDSMSEAVRQKMQMASVGLITAESIRADIRSLHASWSRRDLLERYGSPETESTSGAAVLMQYVLAGEQGGWVRFSLAEDEVVDAGYEARPR